MAGIAGHLWLIILQLLAHLQKLGDKTFLTFKSSATREQFFLSLNSFIYFGNNIDVDHKCFFASLSSRTLCERSLVALLCRDDIDIKGVGQLQYSLFYFLSLKK